MFSESVANLLLEILQSSLRNKRLSLQMLLFFFFLALLSMFSVIQNWTQFFFFFCSSVRLTYTH